MDKTRIIFDRRNLYFVVGTKTPFVCHLDEKNVNFFSGLAVLVMDL